MLENSPAASRLRAPYVQAACTLYLLPAETINALLQVQLDNAYAYYLQCVLY